MVRVTNQFSNSRVEKVDVIASHHSKEIARQVGNISVIGVTLIYSHDICVFSRNSLIAVT